MTELDRRSSNNTERAVSVIIPCYNSASFVGCAVRSALDQTMPVAEVIVIDDGSTDGLAEVLAHLIDRRLSVLRTENRGLPCARNLGASVARGDFLAFLDADDEWYPQKLERQMPLFEGREAPIAVGTCMHYLGGSGRLIGIRGEAEIDDVRQSLIAAARLMPFAFSSLVVSRAAFWELGGFDEMLDFAEDLDLIAGLAARGRVMMIGEPLGVYRMHSGSISARHFRQQRLTVTFVQERVAARQSGTDLSWVEFISSRSRHPFSEWIDDTAGALYRSAGLLAADGHRFAAAAHLGGSLLLRPRYSIRRLRQQRVLTYLFGGGRDRARSAPANSESGSRRNLENDLPDDMRQKPRVSGLEE